MPSGFQASGLNGLIITFTPSDVLAAFLHEWHTEPVLASPYKMFN